MKDAKTQVARSGHAAAAQPTVTLAAAKEAHRSSRHAVAERLYAQVIATASDAAAEAHYGLGVLYAQSGRTAQAVEHLSVASRLDPENTRLLADLGSVLVAAGRSEDAIAAYHRAVQLRPRAPEIHYALGTLLQTLGCDEPAIASYMQVLELNPGHVEALNNLGNALRSQGRLEEAAASYFRAAALKPDVAEVHSNLGGTLQALGQYEAAAESCCRALALKPDFVEAHITLGDALHGIGDADGAISSYRKALALNPSCSEAHNNLGFVLQSIGRLKEAVESFQRTCTLNPRAALAYNNLGTALRDLGRTREAVASYRRALVLHPDFVEAHSNLGNALEAQGRWDEAAASCRRALALRSDYTEAHVNLGNVLRSQGRLSAAAACYEQAIVHAPNLAEAHNNLATVLQAQGRLAAAIRNYCRALELKPDYLGAHSNLLFCLQYDPGSTAESLLREHLAYAVRLGSRPIPVHANRREPSRRLKIGYVSPDLRRHPVGYFLAPVLAHHDRTAFAVHCYYNHAIEDDLTLSLKRDAEVWRSTLGLGDAELAAVIRADEIDILVDLAGHTAGTRLPVFALKPAPVQATWAGYVGTTGLSAIDYLVTDRWESPPGSELYAVEKLLRLPDGYVCYGPPDDAPGVSVRLAGMPSAVTFGCFNNLSKVNRHVIALWSRLLKRLTQARLVLRTHALGDEATRRRIAGLFIAEGIAAERIELAGGCSHRDLLGHYGEIDIALDPFPYSGGLTTLEALWMGVPVVTLAGETFASRHSLSHLSVAGLGDLVATDTETYLDIAESLARDPSRRAALRAGLRKQLRASPLLQGARFTRGLEVAFREIWEVWCRGAAGA